MNTLYQLLRADFLERTRRTSFLVTLGVMLWLGYLCADGAITLRLDDYRGEFNSAWVGAMMALVTNSFLSLFGFYLVKNAIERDRQTGVGQIIATTALTRPQYLLGKWLSNQAVLGLMVGILMAVAVGLQLWKGEAAALDLAALWLPFALAVFPMLAVLAALAVLFECVPWLRGTLGNVLYFFLWLWLIVASTEVLGRWAPALDPTGISLFANDMRPFVQALDPTYEGGFSLGLVRQVQEKTFVWPGLAWTLDVVLMRLVFFPLAVGVVVGAALLFDRFAESRPLLKPRANQTPPPAPGPAPAPPPVNLHLSPVRRQFNPLGLAVAELRLALQGLRWWWYALAALFCVLPLLAGPEELPVMAALAAIWPLAIWSNLGARDQRYHTWPLTLSAPGAATRQLAATWLVGVGVTALLTGGVGAQLFFAGATDNLITWGAGVLFIPALALAAGIWSGSQRLFEVLYVVLWYAGLVNRVPDLNYLSGPLNTGLWLGGATVLLLVTAGLGRWWQARR